MTSLIYYFTIYFSIGMGACYWAFSSEIGLYNIETYINAHFPPEKHQAGKNAIMIFIVIFWPLLIPALKGRF